MLVGPGIHGAPGPGTDRSFLIVKDGSIRLNLGPSPPEILHQNPKSMKLWWASVYNAIIFGMLYMFECMRFQLVLRIWYYCDQYKLYQDCSNSAPRLSFQKFMKRMKSGKLTRKVQNSENISFDCKTRKKLQNCIITSLISYHPQHLATVQVFRHSKIVHLLI